MTMDGVSVQALLTGALKPLGPQAVPSGIDKSVVASPVALLKTGFEGDAQGDTLRHGGLEKAVHHYPFEHYAVWKTEIGQHCLLDRPGAFGENLSTIGFTEREVAIGDVFSLGTAQIQVSQGRQPCWKLNERFGLEAMARLVQASGRTGWYYRVLREGTVGPDDKLMLVHRHAPEWTIERILRVFYVDTLNLDELSEISNLPWLAQNWCDLASKRLKTNTVEDWEKRLSS